MEMKQSSHYLICLQHFFGCIRQMAAPNPNPDPKLFAMLYRLLSVYSLVSPPKGSNVTGVSNVEALVGADDQVAKDLQQKHEDSNEVLDQILELGVPLDQLPFQHEIEHPYRSVSTDKYITHFMAGFTAFKKTEADWRLPRCLKSLAKPREESCEGDAFTFINECYGGFTLASDSLVALVKAIEEAAAEALAYKGVQEDMLFITLKYLKIDASCYIGRLNHTEKLTKEILRYYLMVRMIFTADVKNKECLREKERKKAARKKSLL